MKFLCLMGLTCLILVSSFRNAFGDTFTECENLPSGAFVGGTKGCKSYIYCDGADSYEGFCPSQLLFNTKDGSCAAAGDVDCSDDDDIVPPPPPQAVTTTARPTTARVTTRAPTTTIRTTTRAPTTIRTTTTLATTTIKDIAPVDESTEEPPDTNKEPEETEPPQPGDITEIQTTPSVTVTTAIVSGAQTTSRPMHVCPASDRPNEVIFLPSEVSCSEYFVCYHGTPVRMFCSGQLYFDYLSSKCELPERVNCMIGTLVTKSPKKECTVNTFDYFPYPKNCNYFYKCINGYLSLQQCPIGFGWSEQMKLCVKLHQGRCPTRAVALEQSQVWLNNVFSI